MGHIDKDSPYWKKALFDNIPDLLPEFSFVRKGEYWNSQTAPASLSTSKDASKKFSIGVASPELIYSYKGTVQSRNIYSYIGEREGLKDFYSCLEYVAQNIGIPLPEASEEEKARYREERRKETVLEDLQTYFQSNLLSSEGKKSETYTYLIEERKFTEEQIEIIGFGLLEVDKLKTFCNTYSHDIKEVESLFSAYVKNNRQHTLSIPYKSEGKIQGFQLRIIKDIEDLPKYQFTTGLKKSELLFNSPSMFTNITENCIITEGEIDSLSIKHKANIQGVHAVSIGGSSVSKAQINILKKTCPSKIVLCFDFDINKEEETAKNIKKTIKSFLEENLDSLRIIDLTPSKEEVYKKRDSDSIIKEEGGAEKFKQLYTLAPMYYEYILQDIERRYKYSTQPIAYSTHILEEIENEIIEFAPFVKSPQQKERYKRKAIQYLRTLPENNSYSELALAKAVEKRTQEHKKLKRKDIIENYNRESLQAIREGKEKDALYILDNMQKALKGEETLDYASLLLPYKKEDFLKAKLERGTAVSFGLSIGGIEINIPKGALTFLTAPTGHGKTITALNICLELFNKYKGKKSVFFTYEEAGDKITEYLFNIFLGASVSGNNRGAIENYYYSLAKNSSLFAEKSDALQFIKGGEAPFFLHKESEFWSDLIDTGRIKILSEAYRVENLVKAIESLKALDNSIEFIFIDYYQLLSLEHTKYNSRQEELKQICIILKELAKNTGLSIICTAQFNREVKSPYNMTEHSIGEAGDIERIASLILGLWNMNKSVRETSVNGKESVSTKYTKDIIEKAEAKGITSSIYIEVLKSRLTASGYKGIIPYDKNSQKLDFENTKEFIE
jgi:hypothetical protein